MNRLNSYNNYGVPYLLEHRGQVGSVPRGNRARRESSGPVSLANRLVRLSAPKNGSPLPSHGTSHREIPVDPMTTRRENFFPAAFGLFKQTAEEWIGDKAPQLGAALAYYTVFSLAPLILILLA